MLSQKAYYESLPVLYMTSRGHKEQRLGEGRGTRFHSVKNVMHVVVCRLLTLLPDASGPAEGIRWLRILRFN